MGCRMYLGIGPGWDEMKNFESRMGWDRIFLRVGWDEIF